MRFFAAFVTVLSLSLSAFATGNFPLGPDPTMTPGAVCLTPNSYRYPEHVAYCDRKVDTSTKTQLIHDYDAQFGYSMETMDRQDFKIDHYIPLCAGGGNDITNLWPQHKSVYSITDPLEPLVCSLMASGKITQAQAIDYIRQAKTDLSKAPGIIQMLSAE